MATTSNKENFRIDDLIGPRLRSLSALAITVGGVGALLSILGLFLSPDTFFQSYLVAFIFWFGVTIGSLAWLMCHHITGGGWGFILRRPLEAATRNFPLVFVLWLPLVAAVLMGSHSLHPLYIWTNPSPAGVRSILPPEGQAAAVAVSAALIKNLALKAAYLNPTQWIIRGLFCFAAWILGSMLLNQWSRQEDATPDEWIRNRLSTFSGFGILIFLVTTTFAAVDWIMSLEPTWSSALFGCIFLISQGHSTLCLMVVLLKRLVGDSDLLKKYEKRYLRDIGNLILTFTLLWAYSNYSQWLIMYSGNLNNEAGWFVHRTTGGWQYWGGTIIILHFALPFLFLLMSAMKVNLSNLSKLALFLIVVRFADYFYFVVPSFQATRPSPLSGLPGGVAPWAFLADLGLPLFLGALWIWSWSYQMMKTNATVVPVFDPRLDPAFSYEGLNLEAGAHV